MTKQSKIILGIILSIFFLFFISSFLSFEKRSNPDNHFQNDIHLNNPKYHDEYHGENKAINKDYDEKDISRSDLQGKEESYLLEIQSNNLRGHINLKGLTFEKLLLNQYYETLDKQKNVQIISDCKCSIASKSLVKIGWVKSSGNVTLPSKDTIWKSNISKLTTENEAILTYLSPEGVEFIVKITLDDKYMMNITQIIKNHSDQDLKTKFYGIIRRHNPVIDKNANMIHQGLIGVFDGSLEEIAYKDLKEKVNVRFNKKASWLGITDKYWLVSFIPSKKSNFSSTYRYARQKSNDIFQIDFISATKLIKPKTDYSMNNRLFVGPKKLIYLITMKINMVLRFFDRAIDFGWFYILTKPIFRALNFFYSYVGNFGVSILLVTVIIKLMLLGMNNKSYKAMKKMKDIAPEIEQIKKLYANDKNAMNQEIMKFYKKRKVNPAAGCLPILLQIPIFFSIYKVLNVTIEMRHAPFFGWINDLSTKDPSNLFNLFGILPFDPPAFLYLPFLAIFMASTMFLQQSFNPKPQDPMQAKIMEFMPLVLLFVFSGFPAGLLIYWSWNNILSILQQWYINRNNSKN